MTSRSHSKSEIYIHLVWATRRRRPVVLHDIERAAWRCIEGEAKSLGCSVLAVNGMPDHVHLLVMLPSSLAPDDLVQRVKEGSARHIGANLLGDPDFSWDDGYGIFSVSRSHVKRVMAYVLEQRRHHEMNALWTEWEETDEESPIEQEWNALL